MIIESLCIKFPRIVVADANNSTLVRDISSRNGTVGRCSWIISIMNVLQVYCTYLTEYVSNFPVEWPCNFAPSHAQLQG